MKVSELIEWLQRLNPDYEIFITDGEDETGGKEIEGIENYDANREYVIW